MRRLNLLVLVASLIAPQAAQAKTFMWEIAHGDQKSYLMGSIHLGKKSFYPLPKVIDAAFSKSKVLGLEADPTQIGGALAAVMSKGVYSPPDTLAKHISAKTYTRIKALADKVGMPMMALDRMRPWVLALTLTALALQKTGFDPQLGVEMHFLNKKGKRRIVELEGAKFQIDLFSGFSEKQQEAFLLYTLSEMKLLEKQMKKMVALWKRGDVKGLGAVMEASRTRRPEFRAVYDKLVIERNKTMAETIDGLLKKSGTPHFILVGAGHLVGKTSIINHLKRKGYKLRQR